MAKEQTVRLKDSDRQQIIVKAQEAKYAERVKELQQEEEAIFWACFNATVPKDTAAKISDLSDTWIIKNSYAQVYIGGRLVTFNSHTYTVDAYGYRRHKDIFPVKRSGAYGHVDDRALIERCLKWESDKEDLGKAYIAVTHALNPLLDQCKTLRQLRTIWPEGEQFYDWLAPETKINLPAVQIEKINDMLGL